MQHTGELSPATPDESSVTGVTVIDERVSVWTDTGAGGGSPYLNPLEVEPTYAVEVMPADVLDRRLATMPNRRPIQNPYRPKSISSSSRSQKTGAVQKPGRVRSTGVVLTSRREAAKRRAARRRAVALAGASLLVVGAIALGIAWMEHSNQRAAELDLVTVTNQGGVATALAASPGDAAGQSPPNLASIPTGDGAGELMAAAEKAGVTSYAPTPIFASYKDVQLHLPVSVKNLTEVAFHQANYSYAMQMDTHLAKVSIEDAKSNNGTNRDKSVQPCGPDQLLVGSCIEMWRSGRGTKQRTAVDAGAKAGSVVYAPVTGTVTKVTTYMYEGKLEDYEVHIEPDGLPGHEVVIIHITGVVVREGDRVSGGATPIARIAEISKVARNQLATYAGAKGNHAHIQVNNTESAAYRARHEK